MHVIAKRQRIAFLLSCWCKDCLARQVFVVSVPNVSLFSDNYSNFAGITIVPGHKSTKDILFRTL